MNRDELYFVAVGEYKNLKVTVKTLTFASAIRACSQIMNHNPEIDTCHVEDRKGNTLKIVTR